MTIFDELIQKEYYIEDNLLLHLKEVTSDYQKKNKNVIAIFTSPRNITIKEKNN